MYFFPSNKVESLIEEVCSMENKLLVFHKIIGNTCQALS